MVDLEKLKQAMIAEDINIDDERFTRAFRHALNPAGCKHCGARTLVASEVEVKSKGKSTKVLKSACCGREF